MAPMTYADYPRYKEAVKKIDIYSTPYGDESWFYKKYQQDKEYYNNYIYPYTTTRDNGETLKNKFMTSLNTLSKALKRVLSGDLRKQYQAGLISADSSLTQAGVNALIEGLSLSKEGQAILTKEANEIIAEAKKDAKK